MNMTDLKTLERIALQLKADADHGISLNTSAMRSIAALIEDAIGAPLNWPSRTTGNNVADDLYRGSPSQRLAFNAGVKWAVEEYSPSLEKRGE